MLEPNDKRPIDIACRPRADGLRPGEKFPREVRRRMREAVLACPYERAAEKRLYFEKLAEQFGATVAYVKAQGREQR